MPPDGRPRFCCPHRAGCTTFKHLRKIAAEGAAGGAAAAATTDGRSANGRGARDTSKKVEVLGYLPSTKMAEGGDAVGVEGAGMVHVRQSRGNGRYREYLSDLAVQSRVPELSAVADALRSEAGDATVACQTMKVCVCVWHGGRFAMAGGRVRVCAHPPTHPPAI